MQFDIESVRNQKRDLELIADELIEIRSRVIRYKDDLDQAWLSAEKNGIDSATEEVINRLKLLSVSLQELGRDMVASGQEIIQEETGKQQEKGKKNK